MKENKLEKQSKIIQEKLKQYSTLSKNDLFIEFNTSENRI